MLSGMRSWAPQRALRRRVSQWQHLTSFMQVLCRQGYQSLRRSRKHPSTQKIRARFLKRASVNLCKDPQAHPSSYKLSLGTFLGKTENTVGKLTEFFLEFRCIEKFWGPGDRRYKKKKTGSQHILATWRLGGSGSREVESKRGKQPAVANKLMQNNRSSWPNQNIKICIFDQNLAISLKGNELFRIFGL